MFKKIRNFLLGKDDTTDSAKKEETEAIKPAEGEEFGDTKQDEQKGYVIIKNEGEASPEGVTTKTASTEVATKTVASTEDKDKKAPVAGNTEISEKLEDYECDMVQRGDCTQDDIFKVSDRLKSFKRKTSYRDRVVINRTLVFIENLPYGSDQMDKFMTKLKGHLPPASEKNDVKYYLFGGEDKQPKFAIESSITIESSFSNIIEALVELDKMLINTSLPDCIIKYTKVIFVGSGSIAEILPDDTSFARLTMASVSKNKIATIFICCNKYQFPNIAALGFRSIESIDEEYLYE